MAFLDETGLAELWSLVKAKDAETLEAAPKIATGSYTGTGTYGSSNPNSLTFDFEPKMVWIYQRVQNEVNELRNFNVSDKVYLHSVSTDTLTNTFTKYRGPADNNGNANSYAKKSEDGKTISWYNSGDATSQMNANYYDYYYIAFG